MFRSLSLGSWLGGDGRPAYSRAQEDDDEGEDGDEQGRDQDDPPQGASRGLGNYLFTVATTASKKVAESVRVTTQSIKKSHPIDKILDKTILGDFKKEQEKFVREKKSKKAAEMPLLALGRTKVTFRIERPLPVQLLAFLHYAMILIYVPSISIIKGIKLSRIYRVLDFLLTDRTEAPWVGCYEEELMKEQILSLSLDRRNVLRNPPAGVHFSFDFEKTAPVAMVMLNEDPALNRMRYELVPKRIKEEDFWRNYFYRVSLIKQSAQLASLQAEGSQSDAEFRDEDMDNAGSCSSRTTPIAIESRDSAVEDDSASPPVSEFVSDAYILSSLSSEDISQGMEQLGMGRLDDAVLSEDEDLPEWERELQRELQEFGGLEDGGKVNEAWEKEIEDMLHERH